MGMAASQARYLSLVARKSNCELEGQQINQARTALSNQSANLFNQMLGLEVPIPPSTQDFTKVQYSFTDGINGSVISDWKQLTEADSEYNYVVTHHYFTDRYTGSMKKLTDPQIQFSGGTGNTNNMDIKEKLDAITTAEADLEKRETEAAMLRRQISTLSTYAQKDEYGSVTPEAQQDGSYKFTSGGDTVTFLPYNSTDITDGEKQTINTAIQTLKEAGALNDDYGTSGIYYDKATGNIAFAEDLKQSGTLKYYTTGDGEGSVNKIYADLETQLNDKNKEIINAKAKLSDAKDAYLALNVPTHIGNSELTPLGSLTKDQETELKQVVADMEAQGVKTNLANCFDAAGNYIGGAFEFKMNGVTYYTTYADMIDAASVETNSNNDIDGQVKMTYYNASYVPTKIEKTEKALLETDSEGRFASVKFEDDTIVYSLNMETITDEAAYKDAMNQYNYENAKYDNAIREINAKTSIIQQQDQQLELRLKQLDTEQKALTTEMEAVKKVVSDNVESSFKTFGG